MKVKIKYQPSPVEVIDLTEFGYSSETTFNDLPEEEQNAITDAFRERNVLKVSVESLTD